jgi:hypothetical protein
MDISPYSEERALLLPLFAMADDSPAQIATYLSFGEILVARKGGLIIGHLQIVDTPRSRRVRPQEHGGDGKMAA